MAGRLARFGDTGVGRDARLCTVAARSPPRRIQWDDRGAGRQRPCIPTAVSMLLGMLGRQACLSPRVVFVDGPRSVGGLFFPISITCVDAFIARISAASRILYATCLGGMSEDSANAAASDAARHADVTGIATQQEQYNA